MTSETTAHISPKLEKAHALAVLLVWHPELVETAYDAGLRAHHLPAGHWKFFDAFLEAALSHPVWRASELAAVESEFPEAFEYFRQFVPPDMGPDEVLALVAEVIEPVPADAPAASTHLIDADPAPAPAVVEFEQYTHDAEATANGSVSISAPSDDRIHVAGDPIDETSSMEQHTGEPADVRIGDVVGSGAMNGMLVAELNSTGQPAAESDAKVKLKKPVEVEVANELGWFVVQRRWFTDPVFRPGPFTQREAWFWLLSEAAWRPRQKRFRDYIVDLERGQVATSDRFMAKAWRWEKTKVRRYLARLREAGWIETETDEDDFELTETCTKPAPPGEPETAPARKPSSAPPITVITICNYDDLQACVVPAAPPGEPETAPAGQPANAPGPHQDRTKR